MRWTLSACSVGCGTREAHFRNACFSWFEVLTPSLRQARLTSWRCCLFRTDHRVDSDDGGVRGVGGLASGLGVDAW